MQPSTLVLALIPPVFAIVGELLNPINERSLKASAEKDLRNYEQGTNHQHLIDDATSFANGAVEVAGLAPTFIASITTGFGIWHEFRDPFWPAVIFVSIYVILGLCLWSFLSGQTYLQIDTTRQPVHIFGRARTLPYTGTKIISRFVYAANVILIAFLAVAYYYSTATPHTPSAHP
jgi:hypothetical protein